LLAVPIPTSPGTGQLYTTMTARRWLTKIGSNIWLNKIARNRISHTYTLILIPSLIGELFVKKRV
jgi:hypothetical protein